MYLRALFYGDLDGDQRFASSSVQSHIHIWINRLRLYRLKTSFFDFRAHTIQQHNFLYDLIFAYDSVESTDMLTQENFELLQTSPVFFEILNKIYETYTDEMNVTAKEFIVR